MWFKPALTGRAAKSYPAGWSSGLQTELTGSKFVPGGIATGTVFPGLPPPIATGNAELVLQGAGLPVPGGLTAALMIDAQDHAWPPPAAGLDLKLARRTGMISGNFTHPMTGKKTAYHGVILQSQHRAAGYFLSGDESGSVEVKGIAPVLEQ